MTEAEHNKKKEKVLVTGGGGFIGSHLVEYLLELGYKVTCLLRPGESRRWIEPLDVTVFAGDLTDKSTLYPCVDGAAHIYHLAGRMGGFDKPSYIYNVNYQGTKNLIEVCLETNPGLTRFVFISSVTAIGNCREDEIQDENTPAHPDTEYGKSKLMAERLLESNGGKIPYTIIRLPLVYGPRSQRGLYGMFKIANRGLHFKIGRNSTNVVYVKDAVKGMVQAAGAPGALGQVYILAEDKIYDSDEIFRSIAKALEKKTIKIRIPYPMLYGFVAFQEILADSMKKSPFIRRNSISSYVGANYRFSTKKAASEIQYRTEYPLEKGVMLTAKWYRENGFL